jgi:predicted ATP-binding protein involved in virulence
MNCLDPASSFKHFKEWFVWASEVQVESAFRYVFNKQGNETEQQATDAPVQVVRIAIDQLLRPTGWHSLSYSQRYEKSLILDHRVLGTMKVDALSDGIRSILAMVGDIAYRCIKLNPHLGVEAARQTNGVVLIDEIEMHLHPGWQQMVLGQLQQAFPNVQFIVTTHSPQVLTSVDASCIRKLRQVQNEQGQSEIIVEHIFQQTKGVASSDLLAEIMGVDPIPDLPEVRDLSAYHALIQQNQHQSSDGLRLRSAIEQHFGAEHPVIRECERMIRLQAFKQKLPPPEFKTNRGEEKPEGAR